MKNGKRTIREKCIGNQDIGASFLRVKVNGMRFTWPPANQLGIVWLRASMRCKNNSMNARA